MALRFWKFGAHGAWSKPANWLGNTPAGAPDKAAFLTTAGHDNVVTGTGSARQILVFGDGRSQVTFEGTVDVGGAFSQTPGPASLYVDYHGRLAIDAGAAIEAASAIEIGHSSQGQMSIAGKVDSAGTVILGDLASGRGTVEISGGGSLTAAVLVVGSHGSGALKIDASGGAFESNDVNVAGTMFVGRYAGSHGVVDLVSGNLQAEGGTGGLVIGSQGSGLVIVGAHAGVFGGYDVQSHGEIRMDGGFLGGFFGRVDAGGVVDGSGQVTTLSVVNDGVIRATGDLLLDSITQGEAPDTISGSGTLEVGAFATLDVTNVFLSGQTVRFMGADGSLAVPFGNPGTPIEGFALGDIIRPTERFALGGVVRPTEAVTSLMFDAGSGQLTLLSHDAAVGTLDLVGSFAGERFVLGHDVQGATITLASAGDRLG